MESTSSTTRRGIKVDPPKQLNFVNATTEWHEWLKRFRRYRAVTALDKENDTTQIDTLVYLMGPEAENIYTLVGISHDTKYDDAVKKFTEYFQPRTNKRHYRTQFYNRKQLPDEKAEHYIREVHQLAVKCQFGAVQEEMIIDRLLSGMSDLTLSTELQMDEDVTLTTITDKMRTKETIIEQMNTEKQVAAIQKAKGNPTRKADQRQSTRKKDPCKYCATHHPPRKCPAFGKICSKCNKINHFAAACLQEIDEINDPVVDNTDAFEISEIICINNVDDGSDVWYETIYMKGKPINAKADSGARVNVMPKSIISRIQPEYKVRPTNQRFQAYGGYPLTMEGVTDLVFEHNDNTYTAPFFIMPDDKCKAVTLLSYRTLCQMGLINHCHAIDSLIDDFPTLFTGIGKLEKPHTIKLKPNAQPYAAPTKPVAIPIRPKMKTELDRLETTNILKKCNDEPSQWVSQIVPVLKPDGSLRICLDPQRLNANIVRERFQLPTISEIYSRLSGSTVFSTLDATSGFHQIPLDEESSKLTTFLTPFGKYRFLRLPFGLCSASEIFHRSITEIVEGLEGVEVYIDDILVHAPDQASHDKRLRMVLSKLQKAGLKLNRAKCQIEQNKVKFLGHVISKDGLQPSEEKTKAIENVKTPTSKDEVRSLLGLVNYLAKFCPKLAEINRPLRDLVKHNVMFHWSATHDKALADIKHAICNAPTLAFFDPEKDVIVNVDASSHSLGAVLLQDGRPVEYAAQSLTETQSKYAQIEKELLAIQFGLTHFHQYVYGREVTVESDHKPLVSISTKPINDLSPRLQRMRLNLQRYQFKVIHKPGKEMYISDYLSRSCPPKTMVENISEDDPMIQICQLIITNPNQVQSYKDATNNDDTLRLVTKYTQNGWPTQRRYCHPAARLYWTIRNDITIQDELLFYRDRLIIPHCKQPEILNKLHQSHQGITKIQNRARTAVYWPGMNYRIQDKVSSCEVCQHNERQRPREPLIPTPIPEHPWQMIGTDLFQIKDIHYLLTVDYYSKWINVVQLTDLSAQGVIKELQKQFADFGIPVTIRSDNGPQYASTEFKQFCTLNAITHITSSPAYAQSNGLAESHVKVAKNMIMKCNEEGEPWWRALLTLRNTPIAHDLPSPAQLLQGRTLYDGIPVVNHCLFPRSYNRDDVKSKLLKRQDTMKFYYDSHAGKDSPTLEPGQSVRFLSQKGRWEPATIVKHSEKDRSYLIRDMNTGSVIRRTRSHLQNQMGNFRPLISPQIMIPNTPSTTNGPITTRSNEEGQTKVDSDIINMNNKAETPIKSGPSSEIPVSTETGYKTRSGRVVKPPLRYC